jgi:hypothetical protein
MKTKRKRLWMTAIVASLLLVTFIVGCKKDEYVEVVSVCPLVISTDPANAATNVPLSQIISATFNEKMDPATITQASFSLTGGVKAGVPVSGTLTYNITNATLNFVPTTSLVQNTTYTGTVKSTIKDMNGNALQTNYVWTFSTGVVLSPTVIATDPVNSASGVFVNKVVTATFSVPMNPLTVTSTNFYLKQGTTVIAGTGTYTGTTASFTSTGELLPNTVYTGIITAGAKNVAGTPLENEYTWSFTTGSLAGPTVILTDPTNNATAVVLEKTISATFSMPMNPLTLTNATFTVKQGLATVVGNVTYTGTTASFDPTASLIPNALYVCTITTGAKNVNGTALAENYVWSFTAGSFTVPTVISTDPANLATGVILNKKLTATFSVPMDPLTLSAATFTLKRGKVVIAGIVSYTGTTATFAPTTDLQSDTIYTATITTGAKNLAGLALEADYVWTFTTLGASSPPVVISTDPNNNALNVDLLKTVTATFSMQMNPSTMIGANFTIYHGTTPIAGTISYSGSTISFDPASTLLANTVYKCTILSGVQSLAGTPMASNYEWTFTTLSEVVAPIVISTDPANNATNVDLLKTVTATFNTPMNPSTMIGANITIYHGTTPIGGTVSYSGSTISFDPTSTLLSNTVYICTILNGAQSLAGTPMVSNYVWTFTTLSVVPPTVISTDPVNNATNVDLQKTVTATFSMPMNASTINATTFTMKNGTISIGGTITYSGSTASFDPLSMLLANTLYTCTVTNGAQNAAGVTMVNDYVWTFTTSAAIIAPVVINTDPLNNAIDVPLNKTVSATFDMQMDPTTLTSATFTLKQGSTPVAGTVTYSGTTASFNPANDLVNGLVYTAAVTTGAKNLAGVSLVNDYTWSFTTLASVLPPAIDLGSAAIFGAFGGNAGVTNQGINTVINGAIATTAASTLVTGFHDGLTGDVYTETPLNVGLVTNGIYTAPPFPGTATSEAIATLGLIDANAAYLFISPGLMPGGIDPGAGELGGLTLAPGVYKSASGTFKISNGPLTLDAQGDANATWVFQTAAGLTVGIAGPTGARSVVLINGALPKNVFWYVGSAATINGAGGGIMVGTIIATAGVTFSTPGNAVQTVLNGRAISLIASVTMVNTTVNVPAP